ncbi:XrtX-associated membrane protein [Pontibacter ramchanderi]|uniref:Exosortase F-associated protein n=1 Tax=Pontibacter ramchanderi TaxID=1179743 RepID=A0A2N3V1K4_9BACT|nr:hypothetical protein BD749_0450 [Pontibacter ramchanderi]
MLTRKILKYKQLILARNWAIVSVFIVVIIIVGHHEAYIKDLIYFFCSKVLLLLSRNAQAKGLLIDYEILTVRVVNMFYRLLYCSICLLIIQTYYRKIVITKLAFLLYIALLSLTLGLYFAADQLQLDQLHTVAFRIDTLLVSPMPVILFIPTIYLQVKLKNK